MWKCTVGVAVNLFFFFFAQVVHLISTNPVFLIQLLLFCNDYSTETVFPQTELLPLLSAELHFGNCRLCNCWTLTYDWTNSQNVLSSAALSLAILSKNILSLSNPPNVWKWNTNTHRSAPLTWLFHFLSHTHTHLHGTSLNLGFCRYIILHPLSDRSHTPLE